jgi:uncharacterized protein YdhG (YjbR/CyaY superfamily)
MKSSARKAENSGKRTTTTRGSSVGFTAEEREAMRDHVRELREAARRAPGTEAADGEAAVLAKLAGMSEPDRSLGRKVHALIRTTAPALVPRLWYGMPAYSKDGAVFCHFQPAEKFKTRYATLGFSDEANLDEGEMWPTVFALKELSSTEEARIVALLKKALG